jgi:hypothetical protein
VKSGSLEGNAEVTTATDCPAAEFVGNRSHTFDACHTNEHPDDLQVYAAWGTQGPLVVGYLCLAGALLLYVATCVVIIGGFWCCHRRQYTWVPAVELPQAPQNSMDKTTAKQPVAHDSVPAPAATASQTVSINMVD